MNRIMKPQRKRVVHDDVCGERALHRGARGGGGLRGKQCQQRGARKLDRHWIDVDAIHALRKELPERLLQPWRQRARCRNEEIARPAGRINQPPRRRRWLPAPSRLRNKMVHQRRRRVMRALGLALRDTAAGRATRRERVKMRAYSCGVAVITRGGHSGKLAVAWDWHSADPADSTSRPRCLCGEAA